MKFKTTAKAIRNGGGKILSVGYCGMQNLLWNHSPIAYTFGVYGWNFDVFCIDGVTICTGYRGMVGKTVNYDVLRDYESRAEKIRYDSAIDYDKRREMVDALLHEFLSRVA